MIYELLKRPLLRLIEAPDGPPEAPLGSPGTTSVFRASPKFLTLRVLGVLVAALMLVMVEVVPVGATMVVADSKAMVAAGIGIIVVTFAFVAVQYFLVRLDYDMRFYVITDRSLRIRQGALIIRESTYTYANVQNISIHQGPLERLLGISSLRIDTAGGGGAAAVGAQGAAMGGHQGVLAGIDNADELRERILALLKAYRDAGLGDREDRTRRGRASAQEVERLREIKDEIRALGAALGRVQP